MASNRTEYGQKNVETTSGYPALPTDHLWADCPVLEMIEKPSVGYHIFENFSKGPEDADGAGFQGLITIASSTSDYAAGRTGLTITSGNTDEDFFQAHFSTPVFKIQAGQGKLWFECGFQLSAVGDSDPNYFIGLSEYVTTEILNDTGTGLGAVDAIGFWNLASDGDAMQFIYQETGTASTETAVQSPCTVASGVTAISAATIYKVGFVYDPEGPTSQQIKAYVNGIEQAGYVTAANIATAASFPPGFMSPAFAFKSTAATTTPTATIHFIRCAQLLV